MTSHHAPFLLGFVRCRLRLMPFLPLLLGACMPGPIDLAASVMSTAGMAHSYQEQETQKNFQRYEETCYWPRFNALVMAREADSQKNLPEAYHMYSIASLRGHTDQAALQRVWSEMTEVEQQYVLRNIQRHTPDNIRTCYFISEDSWNR